MFKKSFFVAGGTVLLLALFFGRDAFSYVSTSLGWVRQSIKDSVPIEFEIERAQKMITNLDPEIHRAMRTIAFEEVQIDRLSKDLSTADGQLTKNRSDILRLKEDLLRNDSTFVYSGKSYTSQQVEADLSKRFEIYKTRQSTADKLREVVIARRYGLEAAKNKLKSMQMAKQQLDVDVQNLQARMKMVEVAQTTSKVHFDDSCLARTQQAIDNISARIDVAEKLVNAEVNYPGQIILDQPSTSNISEEIAKFFGGNQPHAGEIVLD